MYKITTKEKLLDIWDREIIDNDGMALTVGRVLANILSTTKSGDDIKSFELATRFAEAKNSDVEVNESERKFIISSIKNSSSFPFIVGQLVPLLDNLIEFEEEAKTIK